MLFNWVTQLHLVHLHKPLSSLTNRACLTYTKLSNWANWAQTRPANLLGGWLPMFLFDTWRVNFTNTCAFVCLLHLLVIYHCWHFSTATLPLFGLHKKITTKTNKVTPQQKTTTTSANNQRTITIHTTSWVLVPPTPSGSQAFQRLVRWGPSKKYIRCAFF